MGHDWNFTNRKGNWDQTTTSDWKGDNKKNTIYFASITKCWSPNQLKLISHTLTILPTILSKKISLSCFMSTLWITIGSPGMVICTGSDAGASFCSLWMVEAMEKVEEAHPQSRLSCIGLYLNLGRMLLASWELKYANFPTSFITFICLCTCHYAHLEDRGQAAAVESLLTTWIIGMELMSPGRELPLWLSLP